MLAIYSRAGDGDKESIVKSFTKTALIQTKPRSARVRPSMCFNTVLKNYAGRKMRSLSTARCRSSAVNPEGSLKQS